MDYANTIKRGFQLVWRNKVLWFLGFLASCAGGGSSSGGNFNLPDFSNTSSTRPGPGGGSGPSFDPSQIMNWLQREGAAYVGVGIAILCALIALSLLGWVIGAIGRGALVAGSDQADRNGQTSFGSAWGAATAKAGRLIGMNLVLFGPVIFGSLFLIVGMAIFSISALLPAIQAQRNVDFGTLVAPFFGVICVLVAVGCVFSIYQIFASILRVFAECGIMLDDAPAMGSIKSGWQLLRNKFSEWFVLALIMWFINVVINVIVGVVLFGAFFAAAIGSIGVGGLTQGFGGNGNAAVGGIALLAVSGICGLILLSTILGSFVQAWSGAVWTLAYRATTRPAAPVFPAPAWPQQPQQ